MMNSQTILITGATGLIGKEVGKSLTKQGHQVIAVVRKQDGAHLVLPYEAKIIQWDSRESAAQLRERLGADLEKIDAVINMMGENLAARRWSAETKEGLINSRVEGTSRLVDALMHSKRLKTWVQGSAVGYYGPTELAQPADENTQRGHGFLADLCVHWESAIQNLPSTVRRVMSRTGVVLSHRGGSFSKMVVPVLQGVGGVLGSGSQGMSFIHLDDLVRFFSHAINHVETQGIFNLVCEEPISQRSFTEKLGAKLHVSMGPPVPAIVLKLALGEMSSIVLDPVAVHAARFQECGFRLQYPTIDSILSEVTSWYQDPKDPKKSAFVYFDEQYVPEKIDQVFHFFSDAKNLEKITPEFLNFKIQSMSTPTIQKGTLINYQLKLHGLPISWKTEITNWQPPQSFTDNQESGPYQTWFHQHHFEESGKGTLIQDWVRYRLPLGHLGKWVGYGFVKADVSKIFEYRRKVIGQQFQA